MEPGVQEALRVAVRGLGRIASPVESRCQRGRGVGAFWRRLRHGVADAPRPFVREVAVETMEAIAVVLERTSEEARRRREEAW